MFRSSILGGRIPIATALALAACSPKHDPQSLEHYLQQKPADMVRIWNSYTLASRYKAPVNDLMSKLNEQGISTIIYPFIDGKYWYCHPPSPIIESLKGKHLHLLYLEKVDKEKADWLSQEVYQKNGVSVTSYHITLKQGKLCFKKL